MKRFLLMLAMLAMLCSQAQNMPYITQVYDFLPAPGQFVNASPKYDVGEPRDSVIARVEKAICGRLDIEEGELPDGTIVYDTTIVVKPGLISLGSYGGYVVFGFDHPVVNVPDELDFQVFGNAFNSDSLTVTGGSCEPGIVMVSRDINGNGIPDDPWYELAGSEYDKPGTQKHFTITYYKPAENHTPVPDPNNAFITDAEYVRWTSNATDSINEGFIYKNGFHSQSYWPEWVEGESISFTGTKLLNNAIDMSAQQNGSYWVQYFFDKGYVDNCSDHGYGYFIDNNSPKKNMGFDIEWAVTDDGTPIHLSRVDFIKVYCGMLQQCGWLGETSTEVCGGIDLHPDATLPVVRGDLDDNGIVDVSDVNIIINMILGKTEKRIDTADLTGDGMIDVEDVNQMINIILKL